jgi:hypothetical protein
LGQVGCSKIFLQDHPILDHHPRTFHPRSRMATVLLPRRKSHVPRRLPRPIFGTGRRNLGQTLLGSAQQADGNRNSSANPFQRVSNTRNDRRYSTKARICFQSSALLGRPPLTWMDATFLYVAFSNNASNTERTLALRATANRCNSASPGRRCHHSALPV